MARSRFDELHDKYDKIATSKAGTRYERLAALVFKQLNDRQIVIHDLRLLGQTGVVHQIDIQIEVDGRPRHLLVECKDFDISGDKVGLDILRNFWAVMDDTQPDEGIVVTCNDFTEVAKKYAKSKGIKLATLRVFSEADWENRIRIIKVFLNTFTTDEPSVYVHAGNDLRLNQLQHDFTAAGIDSSNLASIEQPVFLVENGASKSLIECVRERVNRFPKRTAGPADVFIQSEGLQLQVEDHMPVDIDKVRIEFTVSVEKRQIEIGSHKIAELLLEGVGDSDLVIFGDDLKRFKIDANTGEVRPQ